MRRGRILIQRGQNQRILDLGQDRDLFDRAGVNTIDNFLGERFAAFQIDFARFHVDDIADGGGAFNLGPVGRGGFHSFRWIERLNDVGVR